MDSLPERDLLQQAVAVKDRLRGRVLNDQEAINLISRGDPDDMETAVLWFGSGIAQGDRPFVRFADITDRYFTGFTAEEKRQFLQGAAGFLFGGIRQASRKTQLPHSRIFHSLGYEELEGGGGQYSEIFRKNLVRLLSATLDFTQNDVQAARVFLNFDISRAKRVYIAPTFHYLINPARLAEVDNPHIRELAFWVNADSAGYNPSSGSFDQMLLDTYPAADARVKTAIMIFIKEQLLARNVPQRKHADLRLFLDGQRSLFNKLQQTLPTLPFVEEFAAVERILSLDDLLQKTRDGKISGGDLASLLEQNPDLISYVSDEELQGAIEVTPDHGLAARLQEIRNRKNA